MTPLRFGLWPFDETAALVAADYADEAGDEVLAAALRDGGYEADGSVWRPSDDPPGTPAAGAAAGAFDDPRLPRLGGGCLAGFPQVRFADVSGFEFGVRVDSGHAGRRTCGCPAGASRPHVTDRLPCLIDGLLAADPYCGPGHVMRAPGWTVTAVPGASDD